MAAPTPTRPALRDRFEQRRARVVDGAAAVFAEHGYEQTSVAELAERLGVATGAIYHYFAGKEDLLVAICDQLMEPLLERSRALLDAERSGGALGELVELWVGHVIEHRRHLLVFNQVRHIVDHGGRWAGVRRARKRFESLLAEALAEATPELSERERRLRLLALLGMVNHTVQWYRPRGELDAAEIAAGYVALTLAPRSG